MPSSFFASIVLLVLIPCAHSHAVDPSVVPTTLLHHERRAIDQSTLLENGKAAQKLNAQFSSMNPNSPCKTGDMACIAGGFSQCVSGKYVGGPDQPHSPLQLSCCHFQTPKMMPPPGSATLAPLAVSQETADQTPSLPLPVTPLRPALHQLVRL